jgi:hypothetical protein
MTTVRISSEGHASLKKLSKQFNKSIPQVLDLLIKKYETELFFAELNESVLKVKKEKALWKDYKEEQKFLDGAIGDDLGDDEPYYTEEELKQMLK